MIIITPLRTEDCLSSPAMLSCITFPWEVPEATVIVEYENEYWRVVTRGRPVKTFRRRQDAMEYALQIAGLYVPRWTIIDRDAPDAEAIAS